nr:hypothetical protein [Escherichia coli]
MEGFLRGKCVPRDLKVNETNAEYLVRKFAEAQAKCAALAAENVALRSKAAELAHEASKIYSAYNATITEPDGDFMDMQTLHEMQCIETPATDAFLAEVRAQGVEMFAECAYTLEHHDHAVAFAAELREGGNK